MRYVYVVGGKVGRLHEDEDVPLVTTLSTTILQGVSKKIGNKKLRPRTKILKSSIYSKKKF